MPSTAAIVTKNERHHHQQKRDKILALCREYVAAGWMTQAQLQTYQHILHQHPDTLEYIAQDIQASVTKLHATHTNVNDTKQAVPAAESKRCIYLPQEFHHVHDTSNASQSRKELFVEMCFFARLGYVQPPCCLQCAYQNSVTVPSSSPCHRWVVWRRDAHAILHPDTLPENIVFLPCVLAQELLRSPNTVMRDGFVWDPMQKQLHQSTTSSSM